jgi:plastocyanin
VKSMKPAGQAGLAGLALAAGLIVNACGGAGGGSTGSGAGTTPVATNKVDLPPSYKFVPADVTVPAGTTVTWTNDDNFTHTVQFTDGGLPGEPMHMERGQTVSFTFPSPGTFHYRCSLHPQNMKGSVVVTP